MGQFSLVQDGMQCASMRPALQAASHPFLTYDAPVRFFLSVDALQLNVIAHLRTFFTLQPFLYQPSQSTHTVSQTRNLLEMGLPSRYCLSYESWPLPTSYFSALQKRLLDHFVDKDHGSRGGGFVKSKLQLRVRIDDASLGGVSIGLVVKF